MKYRPDVDGLRTLAVLSVIFYHAKLTVSGWEVITGGYLGVDIFFVISGYLITTVLMTELVQTGRISITYFYERRARRLLPALLLVMLASLPFALRYLLPEQLVDFSKSLIFSLSFTSNFYWDFSLQQYAADSALLKPFLHTWSLAVEEQYYIVFPLFLFAIYRWGREYLAGALLLGMLSSLLLAEWMTEWNASFSFCMMPTRLWELLAGSLLALAMLNREPLKIPPVWRLTLPWIGLLLVVGSLVKLDFGRHHPGFITLFPVLGTVLIIFFKDEASLLTRTLSSGPIVYIGLLSYSLYLWHYPIFAFGRMMTLEPTLAHKAAWIGLTLLLSVLSYHCVEKPFRGRLLSRRNFVISVLATSIALLVICLYWIRQDGIPDRGRYLLQLLEFTSPLPVHQGETNCHSGAYGTRVDPTISDSCRFNYSPGSPTLVLVGDSHAGAIAESVRALAEENQLNYVQITEAGCPHLLGQSVCKKRSKALRSYLSQLQKPIIIYNARLPLYLAQEEYHQTDGSLKTKKNLHSRLVVSRTPEQWAESVTTTLNGWVDDGYRLVIVYPVPEQGFDVFAALNRFFPFASRAEDLPTLSTSYDDFRVRVASSYAALDKVKGLGVRRVYPEAIFCREKPGICVASEADRLYFATDNHVSILGANLIARQVASVLDLQVPNSFRN